MANLLNTSERKVSLLAAVEALAAGKCVALPTETVYGLAADATNGNAVASIFSMKGRPQFNPLICHVSSMEMAEQIAVMDAHAKKLAIAFWPGPLTLVLPKARGNGLHDLVTAGLQSVGVRFPRGIAADVISRFAKPLAAPSANKSGRISPTHAHHVVDEYPDDDLLVLDSGACSEGLESTIVKLEPERAVILRPGTITKAQLETVITLPVFEHADDGSIQAPGMMASHYAPDARVILNVTKPHDAMALLAFGEITDKDRSAATMVLNLSEQANLTEAAANLYAMLKQLDASGATTIGVEPIPHLGLGIAINDRLTRAAAPKTPAS